MYRGQLLNKIAMARATMAELQNQIKDIGDNVAFIRYQQGELKDQLNKTNSILEGDKEHHIEGLIEKVERHEQTVGWVDEIRSGGRLLWFVLGILGINTVSNLLDFISKVSAN